MIEKETGGAGNLSDITRDIDQVLSESELKEWNLTLFVIGSTAGITSFEYEPGLIQDMRELYEKIAPSKKHYAHHETWNDGNGFSHARAALQGPSLTAHFKNSKLLLGAWQQVVLAEFDNRPRPRKIVVQILGQK